ncbi:MAG: TlyA family RNA methyltransferase [Lachnospiraceae bacterium]|nr:TlyA family RNA methyltransferase [Lachnospiraceae bacterium]
MKQRLDVYLTANGLVSSREKAKDRILAGDVTVNKKPVAKPGFEVGPDDVVELGGEDMRYVSRGGYKLEKALTEFGINLQGLTCIDAGASTGGFTDCMLQAGAAKVYAVDVGTAQLHESLLEDPRVISVEQTDVRTLQPDMVEGGVDFLAADLSFISLSKVLPVFLPLLKDGGQLVCLIKPQFEAGREAVGKNGIVKDRKAHKNVLTEVTNLASDMGFSITGLTFSPIRGRGGNIEYLFAGRKTGHSAPGISPKEAERIVDEAFLYHSQSGKRS